MLHKRIENSQQCKEIAMELAKDMKEALSIFGWYDVLEDDEDEEVCGICVVSNTNVIGNSITETAMSIMAEVYATYKMMYSEVDMYISTYQLDNGVTIPAFKVRVYTVKS